MCGIQGIPSVNIEHALLLHITCGYQCDKAVNKIHTITSPFVKPKIIRSLLKTVEHHPSYSEDCRNLTEDFRRSPEDYPSYSEDFQRFPKITEDI